MRCGAVQGFSNGPGKSWINKDCPHIEHEDSQQASENRGVFNNLALALAAAQCTGAPDISPWSYHEFLLLTLSDCKYLESAYIVERLFGYNLCVVKIMKLCELFLLPSYIKDK